MSASERRIAALEETNRELTAKLVFAENEVAKLRHVLERSMRTGEGMEMESGVNKALEPFITVRWGDMHGQLGPGEARQHALAMLECAEAAESDSALLKAVSKIEGDETEAIEYGFGLLRLIREQRTGNSEMSAIVKPDEAT